MDRADRKYYEGILTVTAMPEWGAFVEDIKREIYHIQANALEHSTWEKVCEARGEARGLARIVNLRDDAIRLLQEADDAPV
jgi:hypothetical protein